MAKGLIQDVTTRIVNVHWGNLYLVLRITGSNNISGEAGPNPIGAAGKPKVEMVFKKGVKLLDEYHDPTGNLSQNGFSGCLQYEPPQTALIGFGPLHPEGSLMWSDPIYGPVGMGAQQSYASLFSAQPGAFVILRSPVDQSCPVIRSRERIANQSSWSDTESRSEDYYVDLATVPVNYFSQSGIWGDYLFSVPSGDNIISVTVSEILRGTTAPPYQSGGVQIVASIYSTAREPIKHLSQLINYPGDDEAKIDYDQNRTLTASNENQGLFDLNVDQDPKSEQTDNYGRTFHPYKVSFEPPSNSVEHIPSQPPDQLPLPGTPVARKTSRIMVVANADDEAEASAEWVVQSVNKTTERIDNLNAVTAIEVLRSVTYVNTETGQTVTAPVHPS